MTKYSYGDAEIRAALHRHKLRRYRDREDVLVIDELGLAHAKSRIDVAVINGCLHGYEIKSERDTLNRFASQLEIYRVSLERLTIVCASKHIEALMDIAPGWCGVSEAKVGKRGGIRFVTHRETRNNPDIEVEMLAHLLWRDEAISLLSNAGVESRYLRQPRKELYRLVAERLSQKDIIRSIRSFMVSRENWRDQSAQPSYGG